MRYSAQSAGTGSQAGGRVSCAARFIAFGRRALQAAAGVWRAAQAAQVRAVGIDAAAVRAAQAAVVEGRAAARARLGRLYDASDYPSDTPTLAARVSG